MTTATDIPVKTFHDCVGSLRDAGFGIGDDVNLRVLKRAVRDAHDDVISKCDWKYLWKEHQVNLQDEDNLTVAFDFTGHADGERMVTVSDGTLPASMSTDPTDHRLKIGTNIYSVDQYVDADQFTLTSDNNPGEDVSSTTATLYRNSYALPFDFRVTGAMVSPNSYWWHCFVSPQRFMESERISGLVGEPFFWTIMRDRDAGRPGGYSILMTGYPSSDEKIHLWYKAAGKRPLLSGLETKASAGTISISGTAVTGTSTTFSADMVGAILDVGSDGTNVPTDEVGDYPPSERHRIRSVASTTALTLYTSATTVNTYKYRISDLIDLHPSMHNMFDRACEYFLAMRLRSEKALGVAEYNYKNAVLGAMESAVLYRGPRGPRTDWHVLNIDEPSDQSDFGTERTL